MEEWALQSHQRARAAITDGRFERETVSLGQCVVDECPRETSMEQMAALPALRDGSLLTAAVASQICDGASAALIVSEKALEVHGLKPRARIHHMSVRGDDPMLQLSAPIPATKYALAKSGMAIGQMDTVEMNEAFASVVLSWLIETGADPPGSIPTVVESHWATLLGPLAPSCSPRCCTSWTALMDGTDSKPCVRVVGPRTSPSSSG